MPWTVVPWTSVRELRCPTGPNRCRRSCGVILPGLADSASCSQPPGAEHQGRRPQAANSSRLPIAAMPMAMIANSGEVGDALGLRQAEQAFARDQRAAGPATDPGDGQPPGALVAVPQRRERGRTGSASAQRCGGDEQQRMLVGPVEQQRRDERAEQAAEHAADRHRQIEEGELRRARAGARTAGCAARPTT